jgi:hypothetical protein
VDNGQEHDSDEQPLSTTKAGNGVAMEEETPGEQQVSGDKDEDNSNSSNDSDSSDDKEQQYPDSINM